MFFSMQMQTMLVFGGFCLLGREGVGAGGWVATEMFGFDVIPKGCVGGRGRNEYGISCNSEGVAKALSRNGKDL